MKDNIIFEYLQFSEDMYLKSIEENQFVEPDDGVGGDKDEDN